MRTDALVQYADVLPTLLEVAGGDSVTHSCDGTSFLAVLTGKKSQHRQFVYAVHNNYPEGPPYPIRSISDGRYRYIRNLTPDEIYIEKHLMGSDGRWVLEQPVLGDLGVGLHGITRRSIIWSGGTRIARPNNCITLPKTRSN